MSLQRAMLPFFGLIPLAIVAGGLPAEQPAIPAPPEKFKAFVRYYIPSARDQHVLQYKEMVEYLDKIGFEFQPKLKPFPTPITRVTVEKTPISVDRARSFINRRTAGRLPR